MTIVRGRRQLAVQPPTDQTGPIQQTDELTLPTHWEGVLALEGVETGDGREFAAGSLVWADLPVPLMWQREGAEGHDGQVLVGNITSITRDGGLIRGEGTFDLGGDDGREAARLINAGLLTGVSIDVDSIKDADVELIFPEEDDKPEDEDEDEPEDELLDMFGAPPDKVIFHKGRIRGATLTPLPAFAEAFIAVAKAPEPEAVAAAAGDEGGSTSAASFPTHSTDTDDGDWDAAAQLANINITAELSYYAKLYSWHSADEAVTGTEWPVKDMNGLHHLANEDGSPGPANLTACSAAIAALNVASTEVPSDLRQSVYDHLAAHLEDGGQTAPPLEDIDEDEPEDDAAAIVAGAGPIAPPVAWFRNPNFTEATPLVITPEGRVYGHLALWGTCHIGVQGSCVQPPHEDLHAYFLTGEVLCAGGERVPIGHLTFGTGHASTKLSGFQPAMEHYDHTGHAGADVAVGNDEFGIWSAGALRSELTSEQVRAMRGSVPSGDWRRINGQLRMVAALMVNVPGFPVPRARLIEGAQVSLVAAGALRPTPVLRSRLRSGAIERVADEARRQKLRRHDRAIALRARVHKGD